MYKLYDMRPIHASSGSSKMRPAQLHGFATVAAGSNAIEIAIIVR